MIISEMKQHGIQKQYVTALKGYPESTNMSTYFPQNTDLLEQEHIIKIWSLTPTLLAIEIPFYD